MLKKGCVDFGAGFQVTEELNAASAHKMETI
jgi:hypothetical protein